MARQTAEPLGVERARRETSLPAGAIATAPSGFSRMFTSLQDPAFLNLWLGMLASMIAMNMQQVARGYLAYDIAGSATALGVVTVASGLPSLVLAPLGGVIADRFSKRNLLIWSQGTIGVTTLFNAVLISAGVIQIWHLAVLGAIQGAVFAFNMPARQALIPQLVGRDRVANAVAINNAGMNLTRVAGPAIAGFLIAIPAVGIAGAFYVMAACYLIVLWMLFKVPVDQPQRRLVQTSIAQDIVAGFRYIQHQPALLALLTAAFAVVFLAMPHQMLLPVFAVTVYDVGSAGLGVIMGVAGAGALAGSLVVAYMSGSPRQEALQTATGVGFGVSLIVFALAPTYPLALAAMFVVGATGNMYMAVNNTLVMVKADPSMYGRVMSVYIMTFSLTPLGAFPMSVAADVIGAPWTVAIAGALTVVAVVGLTFFIPKQRMAS